MQLEKMRITRKNYYRRFRSNPVKWQEHLKRVAERRHNMPPEKIALRLQKQREWRRANYLEARHDPIKWKEYLKKRSEERKRKKERIRNGEFGSDTSAATSLNVTNSSNETDFGSPSDSPMASHPKWNGYYGFGSGSATPVSMKLNGPMDSVAESALPFSLSVLLEPSVQVIEQEHHNMAGSSSGSFLNIPKVSVDVPANPIQYTSQPTTYLDAHLSTSLRLPQNMKTSNLRCPTAPQTCFPSTNTINSRRPSSNSNSKPLIHPRSTSIIPPTRTVVVHPRIPNI